MSEGKIYAEDLRARGVAVDESIPDGAWVPAGSIQLSVGEVEVTGDRQFSVPIKAQFTIAFRWVEVSGTVSI